MKRNLEISGSAQPLWRPSRESHPPTEQNTGTDPDGDSEEQEEDKQKKGEEVEEEWEEEDAKLGDESVAPDDGALSAAYGVTETAEEELREEPETEQTLVDSGVTADVADSAAGRYVEKKTGTDTISPPTSLIVEATDGEICVTGAQVALLEEPILSQSTAGPAPIGPAQVHALTELTLDPLGGTTQALNEAVAQEEVEETDVTRPEDSQEPADALGTEPRVSSPERQPAGQNTCTDPAVADVIPQGVSLIVTTAEDETCVTDAQLLHTSPLDHTFTNLALDPLLCPSECRTPALEPSVAQEPETQSTGHTGDFQEIAQLMVELLDPAPLENNMTGQEAQLHGSDGCESPIENLEMELDDKDFVPTVEPSAVAPETIETTAERTSETSSPEEILVGLDWATTAESSASEEMSASRKPGADVDELSDSAAIPLTFIELVIDPLDERTLILKSALVQEQETLATALTLEKPEEESISSESTANSHSGGPALVETFADLALDLLLDPPRDQTPIMKPAAAQEEEEDEKPGDEQEQSRLSSPSRAPLEGDTGSDEGVAEEDVDTEIDVEALDDLDPDDLELEETDISEINLDGELFSE